MGLLCCIKTNKCRVIHHLSQDCHYIIYCMVFNNLGQLCHKYANKYLKKEKKAKYTTKYMFTLNAEAYIVWRVIMFKNPDM